MESTWEFLSTIAEREGVDRTTLRKAAMRGAFGDAVKRSRSAYLLDTASDAFQSWLVASRNGGAAMPYLEEVRRLNELRAEIARLKVARDARYGRDAKYDVPLLIKLLREGDELKETVAWVQEQHLNPATNAPYDRYDIASEYADVAYYMAGIYDEDRDPRDFVAVMQYYAVLAGMSVSQGLAAAIAKYEHRVQHPMLKTENRDEALRQERAAILAALTQQ